MEEKKEYLFVYGTLRKYFQNPVSRYLDENAQHIGEGFINGKIYDVSGFPGLVLSDSKESIVTGDLYRLKSVPDVFKTLDHYEGYRRDSPEGSLFIRQIQSITFGEGLCVAAWVYVFNRSIENLDLIKGSDYTKFRKDKSETALSEGRRRPASRGLR